MKLINKIVYPQNLKRVILALVFVLLATTITMGAVNDMTLKNVTLIQIDEFSDTETEKVISTRKDTIGDLLKDSKIEIGENDFFNKNVEDTIINGDVLIIRKGRVVELTADGKVEILAVSKPTVELALAEAGISIEEDDTVTPAMDTKITDNMSITVERFTTEYQTEKEVIEFATERVDNSSIEKGKTKVVTQGSNGEKEVTYLVKQKKGEILSKEVVSETIIKEPVTRVVHVGTKEVKKATKNTAKTTKKTTGTSSNTTSNAKTTQSKANKDFSYSKSFTVTATAYAANLSENGGNARTAYGLKPQYGVIAVDPKVIPLGTKLYVESSDGGKSWTYGYCIAGDTGGAIKGYKIDLCFNTKSECIKFGRKSATVYILN